MPRRTALALALLALSVAVVGAACGSDDDGAEVRNVGGDTTSASGSGSASATGSASGSASGTGLSLEDTQTSTTDDAQVQQAVTEYTAYVVRQTDEMIARTTVFTDAVRAGDLAAAKAAYAPSREPWESIEPIAGLIEDIDTAVDARVDDFAGPGDPTFTGWHRLEYILFARNTTRGAARFATGLDEDLASLKRGLAALEIPPAAVALGASELIQEVSEGKITGEEDRYSKTDLWDFAANVEGSEKVIELLTPALQTADPELLARIQAGFADLESGLEPLRKGDGWVLFCQRDDEFPSPLCPRPTVTPAQIDQLKARLGGLSEDLALVPGALGLS
jgi:iron uptake system component EfeO